MSIRCCRVANVVSGASDGANVVYRWWMDVGLRE
jgi:hypothetical protein